MNVVVLGLPGAGKGTQAKKLADELGLPHVSMGDILRANKSYVTEDGTTVGEIIDGGDHVSAKTAADLLSRYLDEIGAEERGGVVLDGYPRTEAQARAAKDVIDVDLMVVLDVDEETIYERLTNRRVCPECGAQYHLEHDPPAEDERCDRCGTTLKQRADDTREAIEERISWQREGLDRVVEMYEDDVNVAYVDGNRSIEQVWQDVREQATSRR